MDVWTELQRRAIPFEDNPNSVLRRLLELGPHNEGDPNNLGENQLDSRVARLFQLVEERVGQPVVKSPTKTGRSYRFESMKGKVVAFVHQQNRQVKVETSEKRATEAGNVDWDHWLISGWWGQDNSVYWHIRDDDDNSYIRAANVLDRLWKQ